MDFGIYHIFNRGVERRELFMDDSDRIRFIHDLYEFNDKNPAIPFHRQKSKDKKIKERKKLVKILAFSLMPNHHHLLCQPLEKEALSLFIKKLHGGYARGFNEKYKRQGYLFEKYKKVFIESDQQLLQVICYIHANPLDLWKARWKKSSLGVREQEEAVNFLRNYRWSSHQDYLDKRNFPSVTDREFMMGIFREYGNYENFFINWLKFYEKNYNQHKESLIEA